MKPKWVWDRCMPTVACGRLTRGQGLDERREAWCLPPSSAGVGSMYAHGGLRPTSGKAPYCIFSDDSVRLPEKPPIAPWLTTYSGKAPYCIFFLTSVPTSGRAPYYTTAGVRPNSDVTNPALHPALQPNTRPSLHVPLAC